MLPARCFILKHPSRAGEQAIIRIKYSLDLLLALMKE
jgi:hypothetical protein